MRERLLAATGASVRETQYANRQAL